MSAKIKSITFSLTIILLSSVWSTQSWSMVREYDAVGEFYDELPQQSQTLVRKATLRMLHEERLSKCTLVPISNKRLCELIDVPKGDSMCQLWSLMPIILADSSLDTSDSSDRGESSESGDENESSESSNRSESSDGDEDFYKLLEIFSSFVETGKKQQDMGGGIPSVPDFDTSSLLKFLEESPHDSSGKAKRRKIANLLVAAMRVSLSCLLFEKLSVVDDNVSSTAVWRLNSLMKPVLALPFFYSYEFFLRTIKEHQIPVVVNYLQYRAKLNEKQFLALNNKREYFCDVVLDNVSCCYPNGVPDENKHDFVIVIDMYSAFFEQDGNEQDIQDFFAYTQLQLNRFDEFSIFVLEIAAAHHQFVDSKTKFDHNGQIVAEHYDNNFLYRKYVDYVRESSIGVTNLVVNDGSKRRAALKLILDDETGEICPMDIPLNTLHVFPLVTKDVDENAKYWRSWIGR